MDNLPRLGSLPSLANPTDPQNQDGENQLQLPAEYAQENPELLMNSVRNTLGMMSPAYGMSRGMQVANNLPQNLAPVSSDLAALVTSVLGKHESGNNYTVTTKIPGSTASGKYQYTDSTWNGYGGYSKAALAPPAVQEARFQQDITQRLQQYGGDPYKAIAAHYAPALADNPAQWFHSYKTYSRTAYPVDTYIRQMIRGSALEHGYDQYIKQWQ